jgi:hypothetical protein
MKRAFLRCLQAPVLVVMLAAAAYSATITGTVTNGTTGKPSVGDQVVVLRLAGGMEEVGSTTTDAKGHFSLNVASSPGPMLLRVTHDKVNYHQTLPPGQTTADVQVYDATTKPVELQITAYEFVQAGNGTIQLQDEYQVTNNSNPPRTYNPDQTFRVTLPVGAQLDDAVVARENSNPLNSALVPAGKPGQYYFAYPIRPGETTFSITYHLPYTGNMAFTPQMQYKVQEFGIAVPEAMSFKSDSPLFKKSRQAAGVTGALALDVKPGDNLSYAVSGNGELPRSQDAQQGGGAEGGAAPGPGGGIGTPEGTPDPLTKSGLHWWILGGLAVLLLGAGVYIYVRPSKADEAEAAPPSVAGAADITRPPGKPARPQPVQPARAANVLLEAIKEELFRLEMELQQGAIKQEEYDRAKSGLNLLLARELKRGGQSNTAAS